MVQVDTTAAGATKTVTMSYGITGNIHSKSDVGTYTYGETHGACSSGFAGPHALTNVSGIKNATYCYDANGNMVSGDGKVVTYSAFDKPTQIQKGGNTITLSYGPDRARYKRADQTLASGTTTTLYLTGKSYEHITHGTKVTEKIYIGDFAVVTRTRDVGSNGTLRTEYLHRDHLGSVDTITDEAGVVIQRMSFDAWGKRREVNWQVMTDAAIMVFDTGTTTRGFTGHEMLDPVGLVHMNGRVYDPELGRFLSADPNVQETDNLQNWNRYSYVLNNPLSYTDPTGFFFKSLFRAIGQAFGKIFSAIGRAFKKLLSNPIIRAVVQIVGCSFGPAVCAAAAGALTAIAGGSLVDALKAATFAFVGAHVWSAVGATITEPIGQAMGVLDKLGESIATVALDAQVAFGAVKGAIHGVVGGALNVAQGGNFMEGFAANAIGAATGVFSNAISGGDLALDTAIVGAAGCGAAVIAGGKCANGAVTAAFANLYNKGAAIRRQSKANQATRSKVWDAFLKNFFEMQESNVIGHDSYAHCKANCEGAQFGSIGADTAEAISNFRETTDFIRKYPSFAYDDIKKGDVIDGLLGRRLFSDIAKDQSINNIGRSLGTQNPMKSCRILCQGYRPNGLPQNY
ncbi:MAG: RHS repeat-associated core domain-containing protein [Pseudomonadota bacterium]